MNLQKGRHAKTREERIKENAKKQIKKRLIIIIILLIAVSIIIQIQNTDIAVSVQEENNKETTKENDINYEENKTEEVKQIEPTEDINIKALIEKIKIDNNLTENNFAFFYYNPENKTYYYDNQNKYFKAASTVKVPVAMLYYDKIANGELTKESTLVYNNNDYEEGGGTTSYTYSIGDNIPIEFLLKQSIINSDNTAVNILIDGIGYTKCREEIAKYSDEELIEDFYKTNLTSVAYAYDLINHLYQNQEKYAELIEYMKQSSNGEYLKKYITNYDVAHKYGSYDGNIHDYGIVYTSSPYLIGIFTQGVPDAAELIANISKQVLDCVNVNEQ